MLSICFKPLHHLFARSQDGRKENKQLHLVSLTLRAELVSICSICLQVGPANKQADASCRAAAKKLSPDEVSLQSPVTDGRCAGLCYPFSRCPGSCLVYATAQDAIAPVAKAPECIKGRQPDNLETVRRIIEATRKLYLRC